MEAGTAVANMPRIPLDELERRCQKMDHRRLGNWMARRISRPMALRVTWVIAPWGVTANLATLCAWGAGLAAAACLAWGTIGGWLLAACLLQLWYLLDHVDGQLARLRGTASLDGVQLDYLMHHTIHLLMPMAMGFGIFAQTAEPLWFLAGLTWGVSLLLITLHHDARYKAFIQRLKCLRGVLDVQGGGGGRPQSSPPVPRDLLRAAAWTARKACEMHVIMNLLLLLALAAAVLGDRDLLAGRIWLASMAAVAALVAGWTILRSQRNQLAEKEFAAWYRVPPGHVLVCSDGWWDIQPVENAGDGESQSPPPWGPERQS
jgi:phosphatidylglycerophosphate synthase